ncbi:DUF4157 domain-containing protein [Halobaculum sp. MBLA0147]|uniref:eCIS core domain-containing protein n=1 Tax=Halobaculum sp. MBLA0147 TaxID=3079934 RepID=UPI0035243ECD
MAEAQYGGPLDAADRVELRRMENTYPSMVHDWIEEGVPIAAMESPTKIQRWRDRQDSPIPWNAEKQNEKSAQRSRLDDTLPVPRGNADVPRVVREVITSPGQSLDASIQRAVEERMGDSLGDVRIHTGPRAAAAADAIDARAFTVGNHVAFGAGEYDPESVEGQHVLAHELAHVRQQTGGALSMLPQDDVQLEIDPDPELEREAEETARRVMSGGDLGIQRLSDTEIHVQRMDPSSMIDYDSIIASPSDAPVSDTGSLDSLLEEYDAAEILKSAVLGMMGELPGGNFAAEVLGEVDDQRNRTAQLQSDLQEIDPPDHWVSTIAGRAAEVIEGKMLSTDNLEGLANNRSDQS